MDDAARRLGIGHHELVEAIGRDRRVRRDDAQPLDQLHLGLRQIGGDVNVLDVRVVQRLGHVQHAADAEIELDQPIGERGQILDLEPRAGPARHRDVRHIDTHLAQRVQRKVAAHGADQRHVAAAERRTEGGVVRRPAGTAALRKGRLDGLETEVADDDDAGAAGRHTSV